MWLAEFCVARLPNFNGEKKGQFLLVSLAVVSKLIIIRLRLKSWGLKTLHINHQSLKK